MSLITYGGEGSPSRQPATKRYSEADDSAEILVRADIGLGHRVVVLQGLREVVVHDDLSLAPYVATLRLLAVLCIWGPCTSLWGRSKGKNIKGKKAKKRGACIAFPHSEVASSADLSADSAGRPLRWSGWVFFRFPTLSFNGTLTLARRL